MKNSFKKLTEWSEKEFSDLPWRRNRSLYTTLVSEIMLQQTTVGTVLNHYSRFIEKYPDADKLSAVSEEEMRYAWKGLGYYRRASNLLKAAVHLKNNSFPKTEDELVKIPGIGPYTAGAIRAIGYDLPALALDGNLKRVLSRCFAIDTPYEKGLEKDLRTLGQTKAFQEILSDLGPRCINEALMDLGRTVCKSKKALCEVCPLQRDYLAHKNNQVDKLPVRSKKISSLIDLHLIRYIVKESDSVLLYQKQKGEWLEGQWELPTLCIETKEKDFKQYPVKAHELPTQKPLKTGITKYKIHNYTIFSCRNEIIENIPEYKKRDMQFFKLSNLPHASTASIKILRHSGLL